MEAKWIFWDSGSWPWLDLCCFLSNKRGGNPHSSNTVASKCSDSIGLHVHACSSLDTWVLVILHLGLDVLYFVWVFKAIETNRIQLITYSVHSEML